MAAGVSSWVYAAKTDHPSTTQSAARPAKMDTGLGIARSEDASYLKMGSVPARTVYTPGPLRKAKPSIEPTTAHEAIVNASIPRPKPPAMATPTTRSSALLPPAQTPTRRVAARCCAKSERRTETRSPAQSASSPKPTLTEATRITAMMSPSIMSIESTSSAHTLREATQ